MLGSWWPLSLLLLQALVAGPPFHVQAVLVNQWGTPGVCDFVCDCWDCSDENQRGYQKASGALGTPFTCDFEGSACGWEDISSTAFRWSPTQASISTGGPEPPFDHTLGTDLGWYMTTTKQRAKPSAAARLRSPPLQEAAPACEIRAWYHLWGSGLNETKQPPLTLELSQGNRTLTLWQSPPGCTYAWRELVAYTGRIPGTFQVIFSSTQDFSSTTQLALDDVEFRNCGFPCPQMCRSEAFHCQEGGCVAQDRVCDGTADCRSGEDENSTECANFTACSFEEDWCQWTATSSMTLSWLRNSSLHLGFSSAGPLRDHSTNSREGFFAYVSTQNPDLQEGKAWLSSPTLALDLDQPCYLVLYVHLHGSNSNSLNVYAQTAGALQLVWSRTGDLGSYWFREKVDFQVARTFKIIIEGRIGTEQKGSIALDDLRLSRHCRVQEEAGGETPLLTLPTPEPSHPCAKGQFACDQGKRCLGLELVCNFQAECDDGADERRCGMTDFASGTGGWMDVSVGRLRWATSRLGPVGLTFSVQEGPGQMFSMARAATPVLGPSGLACALQMGFSTGPQGFLALAIADESLGTHWWAWFAQGNGTATWSEATVPLGARKRPFQLLLLAMEDLNGPRAPLPLAVSNISFVNCSSEAPASGLSCNFESGWCGWYLEQNDGFEWERSSSQGWAVDHTMGTGSFLFVDPSGPRTRGWRARLVSAPRAAAPTATAEVSCLSFWYRMEGPQIGTLTLKVKEAEESEQVLWTRTGSNGAVWHRAFSTISPKPGQNYQVIFEALRDGFLGRIALDDITVTPGACTAQKCCSFEADECGFLAPRQQTWRRQNGTQGWGPPVDHTVGGPRGHYMVIDTSVDKLPSGQVAVLRSLAFSPRLHTHCVTFWYYPSSGDPGSLTAYVEEEEEGGAQTGLLSLDTAQGAAWRYGSFVAKVQGRWQVAFVAGGAGGGPASFIALDDLFVKEGGCAEPGSCDFESGPCGWSKPHGNRYGWDWKEAATPLRSPSPKEDRTLGTKAGHYAYVDTAVLGSGKSAAHLASEPLAPTPGSCLRFHYHMDFLGHDSPAELRVKLTSTQGERTMWSATGHQSRAWVNQTLLVTSLVEFQIVLEATGGPWASSGVIAVDNLQYGAGPDCTTPQGGQAEGSGSPHQESTIGMVAGIVSSVLLVLIGATCCLWKRRTTRERMEEEDGGDGQGFDNIAFRDDRIILPQMASDVATA